MALTVASLNLNISDVPSAIRAYIKCSPDSYVKAHYDNYVQKHGCNIASQLAWLQSRLEDDNNPLIEDDHGISSQLITLDSISLRAMPDLNLMEVPDWLMTDVF